MTKRQRSGFFVLLCLMVLAELFIQFYPFQKETSSQAFTPSEEALALQEIELEDFVPKNDVVVDLKPFNPNALDEKGFMSLGFSRRQAESLIKYRYVVGGNFESIEQFGEAYVISAEKLETLKPYIRLSPVSRNAAKKNNYASNTFGNRKTQQKPFYINKLSHAQIVALGFSERQAQTILNFKNSLPNKRIQDAEQFHKCFAVNDYMFEKLSPYMRFEKVKEVEVKSKSVENNSNQVQNFNPNQMRVNDWKSLGFDAETANNIIKFRDFKGGFETLEDVEKCKYISAEDFERIKGKLVFE